jgi:hypothetical protein
MTSQIEENSGEGDGRIHSHSSPADESFGASRVAASERLNINEETS